VIIKLKSKLLDLDSKYLKGNVHLYHKSPNLKVYNHIRKMTKRPIFIGGCGRSGTTLLLSILSSHPSIYSIPFETYAFCWSDYFEENPRDRETFDMYKIYNALLSDNEALNRKRWCEKSPKNIRRVSEILDYFGEVARFINIVRDGRDVVTSKNPRKPDEYWVTPERWINDVSCGLEYENYSQLITVRYEDLIQEPEGTLRNICDFLGVEYATEFNDYPESATLKTSRAWFDKASGLHKKSIKKWNLVEHKRIVEKLLSYEKAKKLLSLYNYN